MQSRAIYSQSDNLPATAMRRGLISQHPFPPPSADLLFDVLGGTNTLSQPGPRHLSTIAPRLGSGRRSATRLSQTRLVFYRGREPAYASCKCEKLNTTRLLGRIELKRPWLKISRPFSPQALVLRPSTTAAPSGADCRPARKMQALARADRRSRVPFVVYHWRTSGALTQSVRPVWKK